VSHLTREQTPPEGPSQLLNGLQQYVRRAQLTEAASGPLGRLAPKASPPHAHAQLSKTGPATSTASPQEGRLTAHGRRGNRRRVGPITPTGNTTSAPCLEPSIRPSPAVRIRIQIGAPALPLTKITTALPWFLTTRSKPQGESGWSGNRSDSAGTGARRGSPTAKRGSGRNFRFARRAKGLAARLNEDASALATPSWSPSRRRAYAGRSGSPAITHPSRLRLHLRDLRSSTPQKLAAARATIPKENDCVAIARANAATSSRPVRIIGRISARSRVTEPWLCRQMRYAQMIASDVAVPIPARMGPTMWWVCQPVSAPTMTPQPGAITRTCRHS
jgi:hypothetical protein